MVELRFGKALLVLFLAVMLFAPVAMAQSDVGTKIGQGTVDFLKDMKNTLTQIGPILSAIMFVVAGIIYAFGQLQPAEARGKYQAWAMGLIVGGFVVGALSVSAEVLANIAGTLLK